MVDVGDPVPGEGEREMEQSDVMVQFSTSCARQERKEAMQDM